MKKATLAIALTLALLSGLSLSACNTMNGAGQDISKGGQDLSTSAQQNK